MVVLLAAASLGCSEPKEMGPPVEVLAEELVRGSASGSVVLASQHVDDADLAALLADPRFPSVRTLGLNDNELSHEAVAALSASGRCADLAWLNLSRNDIGDAGILALTAGPCWPRVERLFVHGSGIGPAGAEALAEAPGDVLHFLSAGNQALGDQGAEALAGLRGARHLELPQAEIGGAGAKALIGQTRARVLVLDGNPIGPGGLTGLRGMGAGLEELSLRDASLTLADVQALAAITPPGLKKLDVTGNPLGNDGMVALAGLPWLQQLESLKAEGSGAALDQRQVLVDAWGTRSGIKVERR